MLGFYPIGAAGIGEGGAAAASGNVPDGPVVSSARSVDFAGGSNQVDFGGGKNSVDFEGVTNKVNF